MLNDRKTVLVLGDVLALALSFLAMIAIRFNGTQYHAIVSAQTRIFAWLFVLWLIILFIFDLYNLRRVNPNPRNIGLLSLAVTTSGLLSVLLFYLFPPSGITPKTNLAIVAVLAFVFLIAWRRLFYLLFSSRYKQSIAIIGSGPAVDHLLADLSNQPHLGIISFHSQQYQTPPQGTSLVIIDGGNLETLLTVKQATGATVMSLQGAYEELFAKIPLELMDERQAMQILTRSTPTAYRIIERVVECAIALAVLLVTLPVTFLAILAILIEDGRPVIYRQTRVGKGGLPFYIYKLRSMKKNAEANGAQWADKKDARITKVGNILRATHIDEVPQMINVLKGDIALIGPRAERPEFVAQLEKEIPYYFLRHTVRPGFTGWAQIKFRYARSVVDSREKFEYDLYYLTHKNPLFDIGILAKTVQILFTHI